MFKLPFQIQTFCYQRRESRAATSCRMIKELICIVLNGASRDTWTLLCERREERKKNRLPVDKWKYISVFFFLILRSR